MFRCLSELQAPCQSWQSAQQIALSGKSVLICKLLKTGVFNWDGRLWLPGSGCNLWENVFHRGNKVLTSAGKVTMSEGNKKPAVLPAGRKAAFLLLLSAKQSSTQQASDQQHRPGRLRS